MRKCSKCGKMKDEMAGFYVDDRPGNTRQDGRRSECKECTLAPTHTDEYRQHRAEYMRGYRKKSKRGRGRKDG
jgi:hypothetical protein